MRKVIAAIVVVFFWAAGSPSFAQVGGVTDGLKKAGEATADTAKKGAEATEQGTKKVVEGTKDVAQTTYLCNDGKTDQATLKSNACRSNGGVKAEPKPKPKK